MVRPERWIRLAGASPVRVGAGAPGSRPLLVVERRRVERGVEGLVGERVFSDGGSKCVGRSAIRCESCSLVTFTMGEPSRSFHGEGHVRPTGEFQRCPWSGPSGVRGAARAHSLVRKEERSVCAGLSAKTDRIGQW